MDAFYIQAAAQGSDFSTAYLKLIVQEVENNPNFQKEIETGFHAFETVYAEIPKLELELQGRKDISINESNIRKSLDHIRLRRDCADFVIPAFLKILYKYGRSKLLSLQIVSEIKEAILGFKYWMDEPGEDRFHPCYFTENHQILFHSIELLAGQLFPGEVFENNGKDGTWHKEHALEYIQRWMDWRVRFGFSEWLANGYYGENLVALIILMDYAEDEGIRKKAEMLIDMILFDIALNSYKGAFACTHGRAYNVAIMNPAFEGTSAVSALLWEQGSFSGGLNKAAILLATSSYKISSVIRDIAKDAPEEMENFQRQSINVEDAAVLGVDPGDFNNIMLFWGLQEYDHRLIIANSKKVCPTWYHMNDRISAYLEKYDLFDRAGAYCDPDPDFTAMTQVDIYTYKTPNFMLSCAQNFRKGKNGFQQHIWQAYLGGKAVVFTNHPGSNDYTDRPNYWAGNGIMPKAAAYKNVQICLYRTPADNTRFLITHAYFPQHEFDEVVEKQGWVFGRKDDGYVAIRSMNKAEWINPSTAFYMTVYKLNYEEEFKKAKPYELMAHGHSNVWICELGEPKTYGSFENFIHLIAQAPIRGDVYHFEYQSPSQGRIVLGWDEPLKVNGKEIVINDYPRFKNPYCYGEFNSRNYVINYKNRKLKLDFENLERAELNFDKQC